MSTMMRASRNGPGSRINSSMDRPTIAQTVKRIVPTGDATAPIVKRSRNRESCTVGRSAHDVAMPWA